MGTQTILVRSDASSAIGTGHVMRCLALVEAWTAAGHGRATFRMAPGAPALEERARTLGCEVMLAEGEPASRADAVATAAAAAEAGASWVVLDGYQFGADYQAALRQGQARVLYVDDFAHERRYDVDALLNQNIYASAADYEGRIAEAELLLGTRYALLRSSFARWRSWERVCPPVARRLLVTLGGADPMNMTGTVIDALADRKDLALRIVLGSANPHGPALSERAARAGGDIVLLMNIKDMEEEMARADLVISAGGTTCWESCFMGLPALIITLADNQRRIAETLAERGIARSLGWYADVTAAQVRDAVDALASDVTIRSRMSAQGRQAVDGLGAERVCAFLAGGEAAA